MRKRAGIFWGNSIVLAAIYATCADAQHLSSQEFVSVTDSAEVLGRMRPPKARARPAEIPTYPQVAVGKESFGPPTWG